MRIKYVLIVSVAIGQVISCWSGTETHGDRKRACDNLDPSPLSQYSHTPLVVTMLVLLLSAVVAVSVGTPLSLQDSTPQAFTVNLDLAPDQRWGHVVTKFSKLAKDAHKIIA